jgi:hypothetical protein
MHSEIPYNSHQTIGLVMPVVQLLGTHVLINNPVMNNALRMLCPLGIACHNITDCRTEIFSVKRNIDKYLSQ